MKYYEEKLKGYREEGVQINTKHIMKALRKVLRQHADVFSEGDGNSSAGSDKAPSEDNLDPEEIAAVIPIEEDPDLMRKVNLNQKTVEKQSEIPKIVIVSPLKRRVTLMPKTRHNMLKSRKNEHLTSDHKSKLESDNESVDQKRQPAVVNAVEPDEANNEKAGAVHKKKLRKNLESKDASTQTDRSDYMLIKQRQKEK